MITLNKTFRTADESTDIKEHSNYVPNNSQYFMCMNITYF